MFSLLLIPAVLGIGLIMTAFDDDETVEPSDQEESDPSLIVLEESETSIDAFEGTDEAETMIGNPNGTEILGYGGNDIIAGNDGDDAIDGGAGNDTIDAGAGDDFAVGGTGDDRILLGDGNDEHTAEAADADYMKGDDFVRGGAGDDVIFDYHGSNVLRGDTGDDFLFSGDEDPFAPRGSNADLDAPDTAHGGYGDDTVQGDNGDVLTGGEGVDEFGIGVSFDRTEDAVTITDFEPETELLELYIQSPVDPSDPDPVVELQSSPEGVEVFLDGRHVATLSGLVAADIDNIRVGVQA